jgi:cytochrome c-type biogenesis protein CcsB
MKTVYKILPWFFLALFGAEIVAVLAPKKDGEFHVREFGALPVLLNGRIQPFDSVGHNSLLQIRSMSELPLEEIPSWQFWHHPKKLKATEWLLEVMFKPEAADQRRIFLIHHPDLLAELNLADKGIEHSGLRYYSFQELQTNVTGSGKSVLREIDEQGRRARQEEEKQRTPLQKQVMKLQNALYLYKSLQETVCPRDLEDFGSQIALFQNLIAPGLAAMRAKETGEKYDEDVFNRFWGFAVSAFKLKDDPGAGQSYPLVMPPGAGSTGRDEWGNTWLGLLQSVRDRELYPPLKWMAAISSSYAKDDAAGFNRAVGEYKGWLSEKFPVELKKGSKEFFFNQAKPFKHGIIIYLFAFVLGAAGLLAISSSAVASESLRRSAFYLIILAGLVHTGGLLFRMHLEGRPPVTNLYSSAIFIGWGAMVLGLVLERIYRLGIGNIVAAFAGFITLVIAHNLALGGDTMEMLRAVLDTNFWLATHVVVVTLGYASTFVAGLLAILYIFVGLFTPLLTQKLTPQGAVALGAVGGVRTAAALSKEVGKTEMGAALAKMVYAIICFATLFSFTGTVLGGIWADQSWGRFWGWDPKENGALIIVLWNAAILHARWGGLVRQRGLMNMAVFGNVVTSFSWFGVNMLEIGLHSYGFMDAAFMWLALFVVSQLLIIGLGLLPLRFWKSFKSAAPPSVPPKAKAVGGGAYQPVAS